MQPQNAGRRVGHRERLRPAGSSSELHPTSLPAADRGRIVEGDRSEPGVLRRSDARSERIKTIRQDGEGAGVFGHRRPANPHSVRNDQETRECQEQCRASRRNRAQHGPPSGARDVRALQDRANRCVEYARVPRIDCRDDRIPKLRGALLEPERNSLQRPRIPRAPEQSEEYHGAEQNHDPCRRARDEKRYARRRCPEDGAEREQQLECALSLMNRVANCHAARSSPGVPSFDAASARRCRRSASSSNASRIAAPSNQGTSGVIRVTLGAMADEAARCAGPSSAATNSGGKSVGVAAPQDVRTYSPKRTKSQRRIASPTTGGVKETERRQVPPATLSTIAGSPSTHRATMRTSLPGCTASRHRRTNG